MNQARGQPKAVQARGAGRHGRQIGALEPPKNADVARDHIDDGAGYKEWRDAPGPAVGVFRVRVFDHREATDARAHHHTKALCVCLCDLQAGIIEGLKARGNAVMDEYIHVASLFGCHIVFDIEALDLPREVHREARSIKARDVGNASPPRDE